MPIVTIETVGSREANVSVDNPSIELMFTAAGSFDDAEIRAAIEAELPATRNLTSAFFGTMTLVIQSYRAKQRQEGGPIFDGTAMYGRTQPRKTGQVWFSFDGTGGTAHIQTSLGTSSYARADIDGAPGGLQADLLSGGALSAGTYYYVVTAIGLSESTQSAQVSNTTAGGNLTIDLSWDPVPNATGYKIYRSTVSGTFGATSLAGSVTGTSFQDAGVTLASGSPPTSFTPAEAPDFENAIGVAKDTVEGTDKTVPLFKFRLDYYPATALMTPEYITKLYLLTGKTNSQEVNMGGLVFAPGTLLFLGPTGQPRGYDDWEIGLHLVASPNLTGVSVGEIHNIIKKGHDYLWVRFMDALSNSRGIKKPEFVYVEQIFEPGNFSDLGIDGKPIQGLAGQ